MSFDTIIFDLDDTIHDRDKTLCNFVELFKDKFSYSLNKESNLIIKDVIFEIDWQGYRSREEMFTELQSRISWSIRPNLKELIDFWNIQFPKCAEPMENLYEVLDFFMEKNIKMGIITNGFSHFQNAKIDKLGLRKYMKTIIISEEVDIRKPDPKIFQLALSKIGSNKENTLFVGDHPTFDMKGAMDAGLVPVWMNNGKHWSEKDYTPRYIINNLSELALLET